jgi:hypothetical protein
VLVIAWKMLLLLLLSMAPSIPSPALIRQVGRSLARHSKFLLGFFREESQDVFRIELPEFSDKNIHVSHASPYASHASAPFFFAGSF